jgi:hypothetical protein
MATIGYSGKASNRSSWAKKAGPADHEDAANLAIRTGPCHTMAAECTPQFNYYTTFS